MSLIHQSSSLNLFKNHLDEMYIKRYASIAEKMPCS